MFPTHTHWWRWLGQLIELRGNKMKDRRLVLHASCISAFTLRADSKMQKILNSLMSVTLRDVVNHLLTKHVTFTSSQSSYLIHEQFF